MSNEELEMLDSLLIKYESKIIEVSAKISILERELIVTEKLIGDLH